MQRFLPSPWSARGSWLTFRPWPSHTRLTPFLPGIEVTSQDPAARHPASSYFLTLERFTRGWEPHQTRSAAALGDAPLFFSFCSRSVISGLDKHQRPQRGPPKNRSCVHQLPPGANCHLRRPTNSLGSMHSKLSRGPDPTALARPSFACRFPRVLCLSASFPSQADLPSPRPLQKMSKDRQSAHCPAASPSRTYRPEKCR